uniref:Kunitz/Bovine pancreatic trypsin inhibitor domain protein n=1 Tax=Globodera pallida TaxID=36090 RepID=A0A183CM02_GLOPA
MLVSITSLLLNAHAAQIADENGPPSSPVASSAEGNTLLAALKRVFMSTPPAELFKNLSRITFYRHVPPQTQVINLPIGTDEDSSSFPNIAPTASTLNFTTAAAQMMFHSFLPNQNAQFSPICSQPQQVGNGPYRIPRWFFNTGQSRCELFYWSGCCGNANNFQSMEQCERACRETPMLNPCAYGAGQFTLCKPTTTATAHPCSGQQFCHVGDSPITTVCCNKPAAIDMCQQPLNVGVGPSNLVRWFFFSPTAQCQSFMYKGLQGNENNFLSRLDCEQSCHAANPCAVGTPYQDQQQGQFGYCSATQQNVCVAGYYCHVGGDPGTSL